MTELVELAAIAVVGAVALVVGFGAYLLRSLRDLAEREDIDQ